MADDVVGLLPDVRLALRRDSRFRGTSYYPDLNYSYGRWPFNSDTFAPREDDKFYKVQTFEAYRIDLLSYKIYGDAYLWWVLAVVNDIRNTFVGPKTDDILRVPDIAYVYTVLQTL